MKRYAISLLLALMLLPLGAQITLKVAAFVPQNSPWDAGLKRLAADFERVSGGRVRLAFPQSLKGASESDIIQKLRLGLDGALLSTTGLAQLDTNTLAISMPSVIQNDAELASVLAAVDPMIKAKIGQRYSVLAIARAGWVRLFSKEPIVTPQDLAKYRISVPNGDELVDRIFQSIGARTVKGDFTSLFLQLSSNAVDVFYTSPVMVAGLWSQFKGKIKYISPTPISPYIAAIVFNKASWERIPADIRPALEAAAKKIGDDMAADGAKMENEAMASLVGEGMVVPPSTPAANASWGKIYEDRRNGMFAQMFSADFLSAIDAAIAKVRPAH